MTEMVRAVDIFAGCGGLSLGFKLHQGDLRYEVAMALDISPQAIRCHNANSGHPSGSVPVARLCDLTWFGHSSEILLYYLVHLALSAPDPELLDALQAPTIGLRSFLSEIRSVDEGFRSTGQELAQDPEYRAALDKIDDGIFSIAICKAFFARMGLTTPKTGVASASVIWQEEYAVLGCPPVRVGGSNQDAEMKAIRKGLEAQWDAEVAKLEEASRKKGRGQHAPVAARLRTLVQFLNGNGGARLRGRWLEWRADRDYLRARFCTTAQDQLESLYAAGREVHLLLGGPPCKGFSRIGRAVVENLRDQGIHSWVSKEYGDERNALLHKYVLFLEALKPNVFIFENVRHFQSALRTPAGQFDAVAVLEEAIEELSSQRLRYDIASRIVKARSYAIPQDRERFIMVGFNSATTGAELGDRFFQLRSYPKPVPLGAALLGLGPVGEFAPGDESSCKPSYETPVYTLIDGRMPEAEVRYLRWIRQPAPGAAEPPLTTDAHMVRKARADDFALIEKFAPGHRWMDYKLKNARTLADLRTVLGSLLKYVTKRRVPDLPPKAEVASALERTDEGLLLRLLLEELQLPLDLDGAHHLLSDGYLGRGNDRHGDWFERLSVDRPCKTIVAHIGKDTYGYIHPYENRALSMREAARVQSFPDFFAFGSVGVVDGYSMIGDAVPPMLSNLFAERLDQLNQEYGIFGGLRIEGQGTKRARRMSQASLFQS